MNYLNKFIKAYVVGTHLNYLDKFIKAYVGGTLLCCLDLWVLIKAIQMSTHKICYYEKVDNITHTAI